MKTKTVTNDYKKVILAVDLKAGDEKIPKKLLAAIRKVAKNSVIEPVAVLNREDAAVGRVLRNQIGKLRTAAERHFQDIIDQQKIKGLAPVKVIFADGSFVSRSVKALLNYAQESGADLIAVSSHGKKGIKRLVLGSFAETLTLESRIPLLVVNPAFDKTTAKTETILFPTDFSTASRAGLESVCQQLPSKGAKIVLLHAFVDPSNMYMSPYLAYPLPQNFFDEEFKKLQKRGQVWAEELRSSGIDCDVIVDRKSPFVYDSILANAKKSKATMIAMVSRTNRIGAMLLGSVTRQVLRGSLWPVWVVTPPRKNTTQLVRANRSGSNRQAPLKIGAVART